MNKRRITPLFVLALLLLLAACARDSAAPTATPAPEDDRTAATATQDAAAVATPDAPAEVDSAEPDDAAEPESDPIVADWPPQLVYSSPLPGEQVTLDGAITLRFDQPMDRASVESAFAVMAMAEETTDDGADSAESADSEAGAPADSAPADGAFTWNGDDTLIYTPSDKLGRARLYQVTVDETARGLNGKLLEQAVQLNFRTVGYLDVSQIIPADGTDDVQADGAITVLFNRPVVPLVTTAQQAELPQPLTIEPETPGVGEWVSTSIYRFTPDPSFIGGADYTVTVNAGLEDVVGSVLATDVVAQFSTVQPAVVTFDPATGSNELDPTQTISITFNMPMDRAATEAAVTITPAADIAFSWSDGDRELGLTPQTPLNLATTYRLQVSPEARAAGGAPMREAGTANLTTYPFPGVENTYPRPGETEAGRSGINVSFLSPMNTATLEDAVTIIPEPLDDYDVSFSPDGRFLYINTQLEYNTGYQVTVSGAVEDIYGNAMGEDYVWTFQTADYAPLASFNLPPGLSQLSTSFPTTVDVVYRRISNLDVELYDFDRSVPLDLLSELYRITDPEYTPTGLVGSWSYTTSLIDEELGVRTIELADGGVLPTGFYMVTVDAPELDPNARWWQNQRNLIVVADTNLVVKDMPDEVTVWATNLDTGQPTAGLEVQFFQDNVSIGRTVTDADGFATISKTPDGAAGGNEGIVAIAGAPGQPGFGAAGSQWNLSVEPWWFGVDFGWESETPYFAYLYTDRPIYRPGDTVNIRGIVRSSNYGRYDLADLTDLTIRVLPAYSFSESAQDETAIDVTLDDAGGFSAEYTVPDGAVLGDYTIVIESRDFDYNSSRMFSVAEYRAPEILATVTPEKDDGLRGETARFTVDVSYFFGGPAADLPVDWNLMSNPYDFDGGDNTVRFGRTAYQPFSPYNPFGPQTGPYWVASDQGVTDANGQLVIEVPVSALEQMPDGSRELVLEATITDQTGFPSSARATMIQHEAEIYVGIGLSQGIYTAGEEAEIDLRTLNWDGTDAPSAPVDVIFYEREWRSVRDQFDPNLVRWEPEDTEVARTSTTTDENGRGVAAFTPEFGGSYVVEAIVTDGAGRTQTSTADFYVSEPGFSAWRYDSRDHKMDLILDQPSYAVGDTARILVQSPFPEPVEAWLSIERGNTIEQRVITVDGSSVLELPLVADYAPNVFVTVIAVKPVDGSDRPAADIRVGIAEIPVAPDGLRLDIRLAPDQDTVLPGAEVTYDVTITDAEGRPVSADFSLSLVDLAVLQLKPDNAPDILDAFYAPQSYRSQIGSGLFYSGEGLEIDEPLEQGGGLGGGGGETAAADSVALRDDNASGDDGVRQDFRDTAFWAPRLTTDASGNASVTVALPDNLTTWRLSAKAATLDTLVGQDTVDIIATQPVLIRPITPRFFTVGDTVSLGAVVNNNTDQPLDAAVTLEATGLLFAEDAAAASQTISVTVPARSGEVVRWLVTVQDVTQSDLVFSVSAGEYRDATKPTVSRGQPLPVYRYDAPDFTATAGTLDQEGRRVEAILLPEIIDTRTGAIDVRLNASLAAGVLEGLEALDYELDPFYQCAHNSANYLLPNAAMALALQNLSFSDVLLQGELDRAIPFQIEVIEEQQLNNGAWGWCSSSEPDAYLTAYVLFALLKAEDAGYEVDARVVSGASAFVDRSLENAERLVTTSDANRQAFFLYVLAHAEQDVVDELDALFAETRDLLDPYAKGLMTAAYARLDSSSNRNALLSDLNNSVILSATGAHWEDQSPDWFNLSSDIRGTAMIIDALTAIDPGNTIISNAVRWLMSARELTYWPTLHEGAWSMLALTDYMASTGELDADFEYAVDLNFAPVVDGRFTPEDVLRTEQVETPVGELLVDELNYLDIRRGAGDGVLYYTARLNAFLDANAVDAIDRGIVVTRQYFDAACDPETETCDPITELAPDQQARVLLTVIAPNDLPYVIIEDPLPAGAEAIDPNLETSSTQFQPGFDQPAPYRYGYWGWWYFNGIQFRDEKVVFSSEFLPAGTYQYTYFLQPVIPGEYQVMPTSARQEFFPEVFGRSDGLVLTITE